MNQRTQALPALMQDDQPVMGAYLDACPDCGTRDIPPTRTEHPDENAVVGHYRCRCGLTWTTSWWEASHA